MRGVCEIRPLSISPPRAARLGYLGSINLRFFLPLGPLLPLKGVLFRFVSNELRALS